LQRCSTNGQRRSARGLRHTNLLQRCSTNSESGFRRSRRSPTQSRASTASFLGSLATSAPSPASFDGCSPPSSTTSGESSRCAPRTRGAPPWTPVHTTISERTRLQSLRPSGVRGRNLEK
jgi:hypothetical protein